MLVILKIPVLYLCAVVWWAVRAEPRPPEGAARLTALAPDPGPVAWRRRGPSRPRRFGPGPHGSPVRGYARAGGAARAKLGR